MGEEAKSGSSVKQKGRSSVKSRAGEPKTMEDGLPSYGAQHRQDALWEGGNEALPPGWQEYHFGDHAIRYQDDNVFLVSSKRPLPGIRLDDPGYLLVPGWEWHISPLGHSYFVNHNNRTTSWKKPIPERPPGSLTPKYIIKGHSKSIWSVACVGKSRSVISASSDGSIRQWTRDGKTIGQPWRSDGRGVGSIAVSPDETMVVSGSVDGRIRLWDIKDGMIVGEPWEGHSNSVTCLDWSPNGQEIASGSQDGTIRRWNCTGQQIAPPIEVEGWWETVKYSPQSNKFAACGPDDIIRVWSKNGELLIEINQPDGYWVHSLCWSMDGTCIFSGSEDGVIRKWRVIDGEELIVLRGHTDIVMSLYLTLDESHLLSASYDSSVRIWDLGTNNTVGEPLWHVDEVWTVSMSPDKRYIASGGVDTQIYLWDFEAALKQSSNQNAHVNNPQSNAKLEERTPSSGDILDVSTKSQPRLNNAASSKYGDNFSGIDPHRSTGGLAPLSNPSPATRRNLFDFLRFNPRPVDRSTQMPRQRRGWNVNLSLRRISLKQSSSIPIPYDGDGGGGGGGDDDVQSDAQLKSHTSIMLQDLTKCITKVGDYPVARGGFGEIWKCDYSTDQGQIRVGVKSLLMYASDECSEVIRKKDKRIRREFKTCARLKHPNILAVYGYTYGFGPFMAIVSRWAENGNLMTYLEREDATYTLVRRFEILRDIVAGLQYLHSNNVVHGDLNGPNVLIYGDGTACLADFGLSLLYSEVVSISQASWTSTFHGNFRWLAPELLGQPENDLPIRPNKHSDIYSFGGIMLHVLTSKIPYYYMAEAAVILAIGTNVKPSRSRYPTFSDKYWGVIEECWSAVAQDRPSAERVLELVRDELDLLSTSGKSSFKI